MAFTSNEVRRFLSEAFSDDEVETLSFDYFPEAHNDFADGMSKSDKIQRLIEYCQQHDLVQELFSALQTSRPDQYTAHFGKATPPDEFETVYTPGEPASRPALSIPTLAALTERLICNQAQSIRYYQIFAAGLVAAGLLVLVAVAIPAGNVPSTVRQIVGIGGLFICSLSALQFREIIQRKEKLGICETLRSYLALLQGQSTLDAETRARIDQLLFQAFESAVKVKPS